jgi:hypothetical protein
VSLVMRELEEGGTDYEAHRAALSRLAALAQQGQEAVKELEAIRTASRPLVAGVRSLTRGDPETPDFEICVPIGTAHVLTMGAARRWLSVMEPAGEDAPVAQPIENASWRCAAGTCGHDDAKEPGHAERVAKASEAFDEAAKPHDPTNPSHAGKVDVPCTCAARRRRPDVYPHLPGCPALAYEAGAEAMRVACWEAVEGELIKHGLSRALGATMKAAIEGAAP